MRAVDGSRRGGRWGAAGEVVLDPPPPRATRPNGRRSAVWHDVECGSYTADLALWEELAAQADGRILELGCGTGRVGLHLARCGHRITGLDCDAALIAAFGERAAGLPVRAEIGDARDFELQGELGLVLAPMQLMQLFTGAEERVDCLRCVARHLRSGGRAALAIVERMQALEAGSASLPDVCEVDGWVYSSLPIDARVDADSIIVRRLRQTVSPEGKLSEEVDEVRLRRLFAELLEREGIAAGLAPVGRREIPATEAHVGSTVILLERGA
jgi:SAM-dependent methyltransferase